MLISTNKTLTTVIEHLDGSLIVLDSAGDINLDVEVVVIFYYQMTAQNLVELQTIQLGHAKIKVSTQDKDIKFIGDDGGFCYITALSLDMSEAGNVDI